MRQHKFTEHSFPEAPPSFHHRLCQTLADLPERKEDSHMKARKLTKKILVAAAAVLLLATAAIAGGQLSMISSHSCRDDVMTALPTARQAEARLGVSPKLPEGFSNGYTFRDAQFVSNRGQDDSGATVASWTSLHLRYARDAQTAELTIDDHTELVGDNPSAEAIPAGNTTLYYTAYTAKYVPADYEMTAQDKQDEADGTYVFGWGADRMELDEYQAVSWVDGDGAYLLMVRNSDLTRDELTAMAQELLAQ